MPALYFLIKTNSPEGTLLLLWLSKIWLLLFPCAHSNTSISIVNNLISICYSPFLCHLWFHRLPPHRSLSISGISGDISQPVLRPKPVPYSWSACQAFLMCCIWSVYDIQAVGVTWIYTEPQFIPCAALFLS